MTVLRLPRPDEPLVSVVLVTYGGWDITRQALADLIANTGSSFETVIVDNPTEEDVAGRLRAETEGAEVVFNDTNVGFGPAANRGVERARGDHVVFLNTDALVRPGWLEPLVEAVASDLRAGAAVPRFVEEDGTVQEAGGLLFRDGSTHMYGSGADPTDPA
ncbi:MAG TPA: glycosyltransferase, partial [Actinomycetota bacterium]|nr:glycosyltransferase [Actinomycetota bacterium]